MIAHIKGVTTAYRPNVATLVECLAATAPQVEALLLIANDGAPWSCPLPANVALVPQPKNIGLGAAYNLAAQWARELGATHLLLLDQDSVPESGMVAVLMEGFKRPGPVAAVGPLWRDSRTGEDGFFVRLARWGARKYRPVAGEIVPVDFLISSGSLISLAALADIGPFDESLFIEHVDTDWALRAGAKGYRLYGVADARLDHALGDAALSASPLGLRRRRFFLYKPERNYYLLRNSVALWRRHYAPWRWIIHDVRRTFLLMLFYALFVPPRLARLRSMFRAVRDGLGMK
jgi:rhamnosyltransferase